MAGGAGGRTVGVMNRHPLTLRTTQALLALLGAVVSFGSIYFSLLAPAGRLDAGDWAVAACALALAASMLVSAVRLPDRDGVRRFAIRVLALHLVYGIVKLVGYSEPEALLFMALDASLIVLLVRVGR